MNAHSPQISACVQQTGKSEAVSPCQSLIDWMAYAALPLWASHGNGAPFAFVECLTPQGLMPKPRGLRLRVLARQVIVYSQAAIAGIPQAFNAAERGWAILESVYWSANSAWAECVVPPRTITDTGFSLYNQAFAIYAAASWAQASGQPEPLAIAQQTIRMIDRRLKEPGKLGWSSDERATARDQNSHMHYLEAMLALNAVAPSDAAQSRIAELLCVLREHLFQTNGAIVEKFDADWGFDPAQAEVEPGHLYEWFWLVKEARDQGFDPAIDEAIFFKFAERHGWDEQGLLLHNTCRLSGEPKDRAHRLWPHCEALRAVCLNLDADRSRADEIAAQVQKIFLNPAPKGAWIDRVSEGLAPIESDIPASSLYHLWGAAQAVVTAGLAQWPKDASC